MAINKKSIGVLITVILIISIYVKINKNNEKGVINFCFNFPWRNLHPGTQNTLIGGLIIAQQFESLVKIDSMGNVSPSIAKTWEISDDFKSITFQIDENKKFINGKKITSKDVLSSWANSFQMSKEGPNNSLKDILYNIEGFDKYNGTGNIEGFEIVSESIFKIKFKKPFRLAIYHLRGARFAIYTEEKGQIIGSGRFKYDLNTANENILLTDNLLKQDFNIISNESDDKVKLIKDGICDIAYIPSGSYLNLKNEDEVGHVVSEDAVHIAFVLNSKKGLFKDLRMRQAFQYLIHNDKYSAQLFLGSPLFSNVDPQIYNKLSQGRLSNEEAYEIINKGKAWVPLFLDIVKSEKINFLIANIGDLLKAFESINLEKYLNVIKTDSSNVTKVAYTGTMDQDFLSLFISVLSFDPDGIYHALGRHGAILNPYMANERIFDLLEEGRAITEISKIDEHYKNVSRAFLEEVPFIHIGFSKNVLIYNKDKVNVKNENFRNTLDLNDFEEK